MTEDLNTYVAVLALGIMATVAVGQVLINSRQAYLEDACGDRRVASSVNGLIGLLFYLAAFGVLAVISAVDVPVTGTTHIIVTKLGLFLLILGVLTLGGIRAGNRELENMIFQYEATQRQVGTNPTTIRPVNGIGSSQQR